MLRLGVLGCGNMASGLLDQLVKTNRVEIAAIFDPDAEQLATAVAKYGGEPISTEDKIATRTDFDLYLVASPPLYHEENILAVAPHGKPIYSEKPLCTTVERCNRIIETCHRYGAKLFVGQVLRLFPLFWEAKKILDTGAIGEAKLCSITRAGRGDFFSKGWRRNHSETGGLLLEVNSHELDYLYFLFGEPESVFAQGHQLNDWGDVMDALFVQIKFRNGAIGALHSSNSSPVGEYRVHIQATNGSMTHGGFGGELKYRSFEAAEPTTIIAKDLNYGDPYARELISFLNWAEHGADPLFTGETGRVNVAIAEAAYRSIESGQVERV